MADKIVEGGGCGASPAPAGGSPVTLLLDRVNRGDRGALDELVPLVYDELRRKAAAYMSRPGNAGHTLQPTALVHEAFARMVGSGGENAGRWQTSRHFFHAAAEVMRQVLVDHARRKGAAKRGGKLRRVDLDAVDVEAADDETDWEALDRALSELKAMDDRRYQVVMLRYFAGLSDPQIAESLEVSQRTVERDWTTAKAFLRGRVEQLGQ